MVREGIDVSQYGLNWLELVKNHIDFAILTIMVMVKIL